MIFLLGLLLFSWFIHSLLYLPFIELLYKWRFQRLQQRTRDAFNKRTPIFDTYHKHKAGTPVGGGILIIVITAIFFPIMLLLMKYFWIPVTAAYSYASEVKILLFTFIAFGLLGLADDVKKTFTFKNSSFFGLRLRHKLMLEILLALIVSFWLVYELKIGFFNIPLLGVVYLGWWFVPFSVFIIIAFANAFNITDGLDGLACGVLMIALFAFWVISSSILDTPVSVFIVLWLGGLLSFLYFNIFPARIFLGDVGALSFGATLAVIGLMLGRAPALAFIGGVFIIEVVSSFIQLLSKQLIRKKVFAVAPFHLWLQNKGWQEPKIVFRFWILSIILAIFGLWLTLLTKPYTP